MTEAQWRNTVVDLASWLGWRAYFTVNATREIDSKTRGRIRVSSVNPAGVGFPDLVLVRRGRVVFAELKRDPEPGHHHPITPEQEVWLYELRLVERNCSDDVDTQMRMGGATSPQPFAVYVWRPSDIERVKEALA